MSKELETFHTILCNCNQNYPDFEKQAKIVETALKKYEKMKQAKLVVTNKKISNDDLEKLKNQRMIVDRSECEIKFLPDEKTQKKLEALEIIKNKREFGKIVPLSGYETLYDIIVSGLTQEEFDLLKEVLL